MKQESTILRINAWLPMLKHGIHLLNRQYQTMNALSVDQFIGIRMRQRRLKLGLSQGNVAESLGCSHQLIQKQESGEARIQAATLLQLSRILGVDPNYFYEGYASDGASGNTLPTRGDSISQSTKKNWNILLIEDNPEDEFLFRKSIEKIELPQQLNLHTCYDGAEAEEVLKGRRVIDTIALPPDLIFLDLNIPKINGFELLKNIRKERTTQFIPVIILTNSVNAEEMLRCYSLYASGYLCKSYDINVFLSNLKKVLKYWTEAVVTPMNF